MPFALFKMKLMNVCQNNRINGAGLFTKSTVDTLKKINIITGGSSGLIRSLLRFNRDRKCRTNRLTKLARDAALLPILVSSERMQATKSWRFWSFFLRILHSKLPFEQISTRQRKASEKLH